MNSRLYIISGITALRTKKSALSQTFIPRSLRAELRNDKEKFFNIEYTAEEDELVYYIKLI